MKLFLLFAICIFIVLPSVFANPRPDGGAHTFTASGCVDQYSQAIEEVKKVHAVIMYPVCSKSGKENTFMATGTASSFELQKRINFIAASTFAHAKSIEYDAESGNTLVTFENAPMSLPSYFVNVAIGDTDLKAVKGLVDSGWLQATFGTASILHVPQGVALSYHP